MLSQLALCALAVAGPGDPVPPNVVVILLDDIGRDKISVYADHPQPAPTPNIDALAARGMLFRSAWAYAACSPTRASLLTGRHADRHGIGAVLRTNDGVQTPLDPAEVILPEALPLHSSIALGKWHLRDSMGPLTHANDCGFDCSVSYIGSNDYFNWRRLSNGVETPGVGYYPVALGGETVAAMRRMPEPFLAYVCPKLAHSPYHDPPDALHTQGNPQTPLPQHVAMTESIDTIVGRILNFVDLSNTYVFLIGDNGSPGATVSAPFSFQKAKGTPYEGGVRIPFIVAGPGVLEGVESHALVHVTDVLATAVELTGAPDIVGFAEDSVSFADVLTVPGARGARASMYVTRFPHPGLTGPHHKAVRTERYKLIEFVSAGRYELYDLSVDPHENTDLLVTNPGPATDRLRERMIRLMPTFP